MFSRTTYFDFPNLITNYYMEKVHWFVFTYSSLKRKNTNINAKFIFSQKFRALKYMTRASEPAFLCIFRSSGGNITEIMQKKCRKLYMSL